MKRSNTLLAAVAFAFAVLLAGCSESTSEDTHTTANETVDASASEAEAATEPAEEPEAAPVPSSPCTKNSFSGGGAASYDAEQDGTICAEFPVDLVPLPATQSMYGGSRIEYPPGYSDEYRSTPEGGVLIDTELIRLRTDKTEVASMEETAAQLQQLGWQQITPCQDYMAKMPGGKDLATKRQVIGFASKDGWDLYIAELGGDDGWYMRTYSVSDFGQAALYCAG